VVNVDGGGPEGSLAAAFACWGLGCVVVYAATFATGYGLYGRGGAALLAAGVASIAGLGLFRLLPRVGFAH
jgi:hypothetical protein